MLTFFFLLATTAFAADTPLDNKTVVRSFYELAFNQHQPREAMKLYGGEHYIQHNPHAPDGKRAFIDFFEAYFQKNPSVSVQIKRVISEDELVVVHVHSKTTASDRGGAVVDIFRLENHKIVEHWDVSQPVPEKTSNSNTMF